MALLDNLRATLATPRGRIIAAGAVGGVIGVIALSRRGGAAQPESGASDPKMGMVADGELVGYSAQEQTAPYGVSDPGFIDDETQRAVFDRFSQLEDMIRNQKPVTNVVQKPAPSPGASAGARLMGFEVVRWGDNPHLPGRQNAPVVRRPGGGTMIHPAWQPGGAKYQQQRAQQNPPRVGTGKSAQAPAPGKPEGGKVAAMRVPDAAKQPAKTAPKSPLSKARPVNAKGSGNAAR